MPNISLEDHVANRKGKTLMCNIIFEQGTICGLDPAKLSCFDTGNSGSGIFMERIQGGYSWEGALSSYRGCFPSLINQTFGFVVMFYRCF